MRVVVQTRKKTVYCKFLVCVLLLSVCFRIYLLFPVNLHFWKVLYTVVAS